MRDGHLREIFTDLFHCRIRACMFFERLHLIGGRRAIQDMRDLKQTGSGR